MTCVIGIIDKERGVSWIGADSLGSNGVVKQIESTSKIFTNHSSKILIGGTSSYRHLNLLQYADNLFDEISFGKENEINHKFMVKKFIPRVIEMFNKGIASEEEENRGGNFIVVTPQRLFEVQEDYSVLEPENGICAVGCGEEVAMGSLLTTENMNIVPEERIAMALKAAEQYCTGVQRPFHIMCTDGSEKIIIE